jgi:hypothetical protein
MDHVTTLWRGEASLARTGGLYGLLGSLVLAGPLMALAGLRTPGVEPLVLALSVTLLVYAGFIAVAVWRSASRHRGARVWSLLAKGSVLFVAFQVVAGIALG